MSAISGSTSKRAVRCSWTIATSPSWRASRTPTAITSLARRQVITLSCSWRASRGSLGDVPQPRLRRLFRRHRRPLLAPEPSAPESSAPHRELLLLRLRASVVPAADSCDDRYRLLGGARDGGDASAATTIYGMEPGGQPRHARVLQVLQFLRRERSRAPGGARLRHSSTGAVCRAAGRYLVLYVPGTELHD